MTTTDLLDQTPRTRRVPWRVDLATSGAAAVCASIAWLFVAVLPGVALVVRTGAGTQTVGGVAVALSAAVAALAGMVALRVLERWSRRPVRAWTALVVLVALLSLLGPLGAVTTSATWALVSLHAVVTAVVLAAGHRSRR
jgi:Family of unknown function (DUF6069)